MSLSQQAIKEFKEIYQKEFGEDILDEEAQEMGMNLISLFRVIYRPIPVNDGKKLNEKDHCVLRSFKTQDVF